MDSVRVCMNGTLRGGAIRGSSTADARFEFGELDAVVAWLKRFSEMEDLFRLCREVRLSSRGFMSGGSLAILRKMIAR